MCYTCIMKRGFTAVEIVIVVAVIAIIAGLGMVAYGGWRKDVTKKAIASDLRAAAQAMEQAKNFKGRYPNTVPDSFQGSDQVTIVRVGAVAHRFCLEGKSGSPEQVFHIKDGSGEVYSGQCPSGIESALEGQVSGGGVGGEVNPPVVPTPPGGGSPGATPLPGGGDAGGGPGSGHLRPGDPWTSDI